jgi:hypothetical protein
MYTVTSLPSSPPAADFDPRLRVLGSVLDGIVEQMDERLPQKNPVAVHVRKVAHNALDATPRNMAMQLVHDLLPRLRDGVHREKACDLNIATPGGIRMHAGATAVPSCLFDGWYPPL